MTFKAERDLRFTLQLTVITISAAAALAAYLLLGNLMAIMVFVPLALTAFVCGMQFFATGYTLDGDLLIAKSGLSKVMVAYGDITLVTHSKDTHADGYVPLATSSRRIYIFYTQDDKSYRLELSPYDMEGFVKTLEEKL